MDPIIENFSIVDVLLEIMSSKIIKVNEEIGTLNNSLEKTMGLQEQLDNSLMVLNSVAALLNVPVSLQGKNGVLHLDEEPEITDGDKRKSKINGSDILGDDYRSENEVFVSKNGNIADQTKQLVETVPKLAENTLKVLKTLDKLPPGLDKWMKGLEIFKEVTEGGSGIASLLSASEGSATIAGGIEMGAEIMAGAAGTLEAAAVFGVPGLVAAGAIVVTQEIITEIERQHEQKKKNVEDEKEARSQLANFRMPEKKVNDLLASFDHVVDEPVHAWNIKSNIADEVLRKKGKAAYTLSYPVPIAIADGVSYPQNLPPEKWRSTEYAAPDKINFYEKMFDLEQYLKNVAYTGGPDLFIKRGRGAILAARKFDKKNHSNTEEDARLAVKEVGSFLLNDANKGTIVPNGRMLSSTGSSRHHSPSIDNNAGSVINISLNRPMIENFIVNTKDSKEGIGVMKRQVEEALLEILNSANAIH